MNSALGRDGHCLVGGLATPGTIGALIAAIESDTGSHRVRGDAVFGARNLLDRAAVGAFVRSEPVQAQMCAVLGEGAVAVRGLFFDKTPAANWPVAWHQDLTVALRERREVEGWTNWSVKAGVTHVQPPAAILERMLALRLHLDDCGDDNGPLRVISGSHRFGRLSRERHQSLLQQNRETICCAPAGSALLMRPLLLHASSAAKRPGHRRVLHIEFAAADVLPPALRWTNA